MATVGPATASPEGMEGLLRAGADVVRLNFSHGRREQHRQAVELVRSTSERLGLPVALMGDLCGPKIRLLEVQDDAVELAAGSELRVVREPVVGDVRRVSVNMPALFDDARVGDRVLIDDGAIRLHVTAADDDGLTCLCDVGGTLRSRKGLNLPDTDLHVPALTDRDEDDLRFAAESGMEYLALSFVRRAADVGLLRGRLAALGADSHIVAKIETRHAVDDLDAIIEASDGVIVARGDLGVEVDVAIVPRLQKEITERCRRAGRPVIIATQMLQSMVASATPTRAEVNDVANAIFDGADAVLLSAETAVGRHPAEAVGVLDHVGVETEAYDQAWQDRVAIGDARADVTVAVARSVAAVANDIGARAVVVWTETGKLARLVSKHRLDRPVIAVTRSAVVRRRLALYYGVSPVLAERPGETDGLVATVDALLTEGGWAGPGDLVVVAFGPGTLAGGDTGSIIIHTVSGA